jgi:hypothetical protein
MVPAPISLTALDIFGRPDQQVRHQNLDPPLKMHFAQSTLSTWTQNKVPFNNLETVCARIVVKSCKQPAGSVLSVTCYEDNVHGRYGTDGIKYSSTGTYFPLYGRHLNHVFQTSNNRLNTPHASEVTKSSKQLLFPQSHILLRRLQLSKFDSLFYYSIN